MPPSVQWGELSPVLQATGSYVGLGSVVLCWVYCVALGWVVNWVVLGWVRLGWVGLHWVVLLAWVDLG